MTIYVDITQLEKGRANTGIQRVVKEFLKRAVASSDVHYKLFIFKENLSKIEILDNQEIISFLEDTQHYTFKKREEFNLLNCIPKTPTAFLDIDAAWNVVYKRADLYPRLKNNGFLIFNFIYDLIPMLFPHFAHEVTKKNFKKYIYSVFSYSDLVMFDSLSANMDFLKLQKQHKFLRNIPTRTVGLGSNFLKVKEIPKEKKIQNILSKKYLLFVGTIEPRKNQEDVLDAFEVLAKKYDDLHLVIIGKKGWKVEALSQRILTHPLHNERLFWLDNIDDNTLSQFYQNAFIVTYLSKYEGYGLPIAESLSYANITITSKNSSMYEVGRDFADYVMYGSQNELVSLISLYYENKSLYEAKKRFIQENFKTTSWDDFYTSMADIFIHYEDSLTIKKTHLSSLQFVFISIDKENLQGTIALTDKYVDFVKEYIIVTQKKLIKEFQGINSIHKITLIDEETILGTYKEGFASRDHVSKNWLLRCSLLNIDTLEDEFIMLDDDNRPLKQIEREQFISADGSYNIYYFYQLLEWHHKNTDYDVGQQNMKTLLSRQNYELLAYSSHSPQIINKKIFCEAVKKFFDTGLEMAIDEWSIYYNYAVSLYPCAFHKKPFETLSWPASPSDWELQIIPQKFTFENYYKEQYDIGFFKPSDTLEEKTKKKRSQLRPTIQTREIFQENLDILAKNNMVHKVASFKKDTIELYITGIPYFVVARKNSSIRLQLNYKLLNPLQKDVEVSLGIFLNGSGHGLYKIKTQVNCSYEESIFEVPIIVRDFKEGMYNISFNLMLNGKYIYAKESPYAMKLIVSQSKDIKRLLGQVSKPPQEKNFKQKIKSIPFFGWFVRWNYNLLRLNNLKHRVFMQEHTLKQLHIQLQNQQTQLQNQRIELQNQQIQLHVLHQTNEQTLKNYENLQATMQTTIAKAVAKQISFQSDAFEQRLDQFIFDAKIDLQIDKEHE